MNNDDFIGGVLLLIASCMVLLNVRRAYQDKQIRGVNPVSILFFSGINLYYMWLYIVNMDKFFWSFLGSLALGLVQLIWFSQIIYYNGTSKNTWIKTTTWLRKLFLQVKK